MKRAQACWTASVHAIEAHRYQHEQPDGWATVSSCDGRYLQNVKQNKLYATEAGATLARIAMLQKTVRGLETAVRNHKRTIAKLKRQLRKQT